MSEKLTGGEAILRSVLRHGVDTIFGLPGVQTYPLFDALARHGNAVRTLGVRHEQTAAYMAMGYAKVTGRPGVYSVVPGPGVLNTGAALITGMAVNAPMLLLTGQVPAPFLGRGRGHLHELPDQAGTLASFIKWAGRVPRAAEAPAVVDEAFARMLGGRPGPVSVEMCWDTMAQSETVALPPVAAAAPPPPPDPAALDAAVDVIRAAQRPMIMVGNGAQHAGAEVIALAEALGAPVTAFRGGRGVVDEAHALGVSSVAAYALWPETDLLIGIGSRCEMQAMRWSGMTDAGASLGGRKLVRVDIDAEEMLRLRPDVAIVADAAAGAGALAAACAAGVADMPARLAAVAAAKQAARDKVAVLTPHVDYLAAIRAALPPEGIFVKDICQTG
ncbi:MAG: thiamine pyrophosphate-binding protein, partial [Thalassobaculaceae bacterium]